MVPRDGDAASQSNSTGQPVSDVAPSHPTMSTCAPSTIRAIANARSPYRGAVKLASASTKMSPLGNSAPAEGEEITGVAVAWVAVTVTAELSTGAPAS